MKKIKQPKADVVDTVDPKDQQIETLKLQLARALADYDNLQKRVERQSVELYQVASKRIVKQLLPILDMLGDAQKHLMDPGLAISVKEFEEVLKNEGYFKIEPKIGEKFNPDLNEAIDVLETDQKDVDNTISTIALIGWGSGEGSVVRPAKVVVRKFKGE